MNCCVRLRWWALKVTICVLLLLSSVGEPVCAQIPPGPTTTIYGQENTEQLWQETLQLSQRWDPTQELYQQRLRQYLVRRSQYLSPAEEKHQKEQPAAALVQDFLQHTEPCLSEVSRCLQPHTPEDKASFYTWFTAADYQQIRGALEQLYSGGTLSPRRARILNLLMHSLWLGVQESAGPNDDSDQGDLIRQYFLAAGVVNPYREIAAERQHWAWCAAFVTSILHRAGTGMSFVSFADYAQACRSKERPAHYSCHPVQVDFILNWARQRARVRQASRQTIGQIRPGDLLILTNREGVGQHVGFFLAPAEADWVFTVEGNIGPHLNDVLEDRWQEVQALMAQGAITPLQYQLLLDRLTVVKRPLTSWDYFVDVDW